MEGIFALKSSPAGNFDWNSVVGMEWKGSLKGAKVKAGFNSFALTGVDEEERERMRQKFQIFR